MVYCIYISKALITTFGDILVIEIKIKIAFGRLTGKYLKRSG